MIMLYYDVKNSPWPFMIGLMVLMLAGSFMWFLNNGNSMFLFFSLILLTMSVIAWWKDLINEALLMGSHVIEIQDCLKFSMMLFIFSECMFFFSFFWAFFHMSLSPSPLIGLVWPPVGVLSLDPYATPLLNTCILLSSGVTLTVAHYKMYTFKILSSSNYTYNWHESFKSPVYVFVTIILGIMFTRYQYFEYKVTSFTFSDSVYGSCFYMATGFHGIHVIVGTLFLIAVWIRLGMMINNLSCQFSRDHHISFELAIWYWHFVDVVWLFLFIVIYIWGS